MIEFQLRTDPQIIRAILPKMKQIYSAAAKHSWKSDFLCPVQGDEEFSESWINGLTQDSSEDRLTLAKVIMDPRLQHGYVEIDSEEAENLIRALSEMRLFIRQSFLSELSDDELETGDFDLEKQNGSNKICYFSYLVLAEMQETLIDQLD